ncbi:DUF5989 family protein [Mucilaginibacter polytrichastri]|nr:DUF5989 family protein [Mucilaginibacter polytrichastri]
MEILIEFCVFLKQRKRYWLWPTIILIVFLSLFIVIAQSTALSTLIYSLF